MSVRIQVGTDGTIGDVTDPMSPNVHEDSGAPAPAQIRINQPRVRVTYNTETGSARVETSEQQGTYRAAPATQQGASVKTASGTPTVLAAASPEDVVNIPGLGETSVEAAVTMGYLQPRLGGGYELVGAQQQAPAAQQQAPAAQQQQQQQQQEAPKQEQPGDVRGVPPTSSATDATLAALQSKAPVALEGILSSISQGTVPDTLIEDAARQMGDERLADSVRAMHGEFLASGQAALRNVGVENPADFEAWARETFPDESADAVRELVTHRSVAGLQTLGRKYAAQANQRLATLIQSHGVDTEVRNGIVYVKRSALGLPPTPRRGDFGGSDWSPARDLIRDGHIELNG
jgi:hypothetical protein